MAFTQVDREQLFAPMAYLWTQTYPGNPVTTEEMAVYYDRSHGGAYQEYWLDEGGSGAISLIAPNVTMPPTRLDGEVFVREVANNDRALEFAESRTRAIEASSLCVWSRSDLDSRQEVLRSRGYSVIQTAPTSTLAIQHFDATRFAERVGRCPYSVVSVNELIERGVDWIPLLYEATSEMAEDVPDPHDHDPMPYEDYVIMVQNPVVYDFDLMFVALDGDQIVGYTRVSPSRADPTLVNTGLSGVVRSHRRQGIVTALKVRAIEALRSRGFVTLMTDNDVSNPMYQLNLDLGFEWMWDWVQFQKVF